jgi:hypothetical protein
MITGKVTDCQQKQRDESAQVDSYRHVATVQRHAKTLNGKRTHGRSAFTHEEHSRI